MIDVHNLLVTIHSEESKILSNIKYNINYDLKELRNRSMVITGDKEKDAENNFYLINILKVADKLNEVIAQLESHDAWYNQYITQWKENKEKGD